ncbi:enoyl-CoA hydratase/isomerase family protein, partial [Streptomyces sp. NRRL S-146]
MSEERFGEFVLVRRHEQGHVAELVLDRPKAMNAVSTEMARSIAGACTALGEDREVRAVVLTSTHERAFCVGADLKERNSFSDADLLRQRPVTRGAYTGVLELPVPTVAAVHGFALGGGFE